jgi:asparagine synthase (glutamine-hydrolysing)
VLVSDSAAVLAQYTGAPLNETELALAIAGNVPLHLFPTSTHWTGVFAVPAMHWLRVDSNGNTDTIRWWYPPQPDASIADASERLRDTLLTTLERESTNDRSISADLSGGLDSTSIVYALSHLRRRPALFHAVSSNQRNDDDVWATRASEDLDLDLITLGSFADHSASFDVNAARQTMLDHPPIWRGSAGYLELLAEKFDDGRNHVHFTGIGGDELFGFVPALIWSLAATAGRRHPAIRRFRLLHRWTGRATSRALRSTASVSLEVQASLDRLRAPEDSGPASTLAWNPRVTLPAWATGETEALVHTALRQRVGAGIEPLDSDRMRHQILESLAFQGMVVRQINQSYGDATRVWYSPFLDRSVVEAAMSLRIEDRIGADVAKPLLAAASKPFMPTDFFRRNGKGEYSMDVYAEFGRKRDQLVERFAQSRLAARGLIDPDVLAASVSSPVAAGDVISGVERLVSLENWLSDVDAASSMTAVATHERSKGSSTRLGWNQQ